MHGELTVGDVVRGIRDADISEDRLRELHAQLERGVSPEDFARAKP
jgi:hypothetical protein